MSTSTSHRSHELSERDALIYAPPATRTRISNAERTERDAGRRRREAEGAQGQATDWHEDTLRSLLIHKTDDKGRSDLASLLAELTEGHGLGWSDVARLTGVSVPAVRKWRLGGDVSPGNRLELARLAAFMDMLQEEGVSDPATWLMVPFDDESSISKGDVYRQGGSGATALLAFAKGYVLREDVLRNVLVLSPAAPQSTKVVRAPDGRLSIVPDRGE